MVGFYMSRDALLLCNCQYGVSVNEVFPITLHVLLEHKHFMSVFCFKVYFS